MKEGSGTRVSTRVLVTNHLSQLSHFPPRDKCQSSKQHKKRRPLDGYCPPDSSIMGDLEVAEQLRRWCHAVQGTR